MTTALRSKLRQHINKSFGPLLTRRGFCQYPCDDQKTAPRMGLMRFNGYLRHFQGIKARIIKKLPSWEMPATMLIRLGSRYNSPTGSWFVVCRSRKSWNQRNILFYQIRKVINCGDRRVGCDCKFCRNFGGWKVLFWNFIKTFILNFVFPASLLSESNNLLLMLSKHSSAAFYYHR